MCGGSHLPHQGRHHIRGLSPRVRGKPDYGDLIREKLRSIPACAGEALTATPALICPAVYPRVCGGSRYWRIFDPGRGGLSPRVRGKPSRCNWPITSKRSIPACAGEAHTAYHVQPIYGVYPRVCGGSRLGLGLRLRHSGLSPRVRGKPRRARGRWLATRSIPACAGEARRGCKG